MALEVLMNDGGGHRSSEVVSFDAAREANHRIANVLTLLASSVRVQANTATRRESISGDEMRLQLAGIAARIDSVGQVHKLLANGVSESRIGLREQLEKIGEGLKPFASLKGPVELTTEVNEVCVVNAAQVVPLALIVCEMVTNAIKYAHPAGVAGTIHVVGASDDAFTVVEVADDGVGLPEGFDPRVDGGLGFQLVRSLAKQLGATLVFDTDALGLTFKIFLPKHPARAA